MNSLADLPAPHRRSSAVGGVYSALLELLRAGNFKPGDKLPNERDLAQRFRTGRATLRDALLIAQEEGLVRRHVGSGTFLSRSAPQIIEIRDAGVDVSSNAPVSFHEVLEARLVMEPGVTALAAEHHNDENLARMRRALTGVRNAATWFEFKESLYEVFREIYRASGNSLLQETFERIVDARRRVNYDGRRLESKVSELVREQAHDEIEIIVEAVAERDRDEAERQSHDYLFRMFTNVTL